MAQISINSKTHGHHIIFYDSNDANIIAKFSWYIVRRYKMFYAAAHAKNSIGKNTIVYMHRMLVTYNRVDHRNGNGLDNRRENLRESTRHQNKMNSTKHKKLTSVYKGVCWNKKDKKWRAQVTVNGKNIFIGSFKEEKVAALAYDVSARNYYGVYAKTNF